MVFNFIKKYKQEVKDTKVKLYREKYSLDDYVVIDIETSGLDPEKNEILELGAVKVRDNVIVDTYDQCVNFLLTFIVARIIINLQINLVPYVGTGKF